MTTSIIRKSLLVATLAAAWGPMTLGVLGADPVIHADWDDGGSPVLGVDYFVTTTSPASVDFPDVELDTGSLTWRIWSTDTDNPSDIGDIGVISCPNPHDFGVSIVGDAAPGARNMKGIILVPSTDSYSGKLIDGFITGDLDGDLIVLEDNDNMGGTVESFTIVGNANGDITVFAIGPSAFLNIQGNASGDIVIDRIKGAGGFSVGCFAVEGNLTGTITVDTVGPDPASLLVGGNASGNITVGTLEGAVTVEGDLSSTISITTKMDTGNVTVNQDFTSTAVVDIADAVGSSILQFNTDSVVIGPWYDFSGDVILREGIGSSVFVNVYGNFNSTGLIDLKTKDVAGHLQLTKSGAGVIDNGGAVSGTVQLASLTPNVFSGTAEFASISSSGTVKAQGASDVSGTITITGNVAGFLDLSNDLTSLGSIDIGGNLESTGSITIGNDCAGDISVAGKFDGDADITGDVTSAGSIVCETGTIGDISVGGDMAGAINVDSDAAGDIDIGQDHSGTITVEHNLGLRGRILVDGLISGSIDIGRATIRGSLIHPVEGLASGGTIEINTSLGDYDANGDITFGTPVAPLPDVTFDGCIRIYDDAGGPPSGGSLEGDINVIGCHDTDDPLNICVDGSINGSVTITQAGCDETVLGYSCDGCP